MYINRSNHYLKMIIIYSKYLIFLKVIIAICILQMELILIFGIIKVILIIEMKQKTKMNAIIEEQ